MNFKDLEFKAEDTSHHTELFPTGVEEATYVGRVVCVEELKK